MRPVCVLIAVLTLATGPSLCQNNPSPKSTPTIPNLPDVNPQLLRLAIQDQSDRGNDLFSGKQVKTPQDLNVPKRDAERQAEVRTLLSEGKSKRAGTTTSQDESFSTPSRPRTC